MSKEVFGEELWNSIQGVVKDKGINFIVDNKEKPDYIPKSRFDEVIGSKNELKTQVMELSSQLNTLKESAKGNETFTKQIEELQEKNNGWESKYKNTLLESAIKLSAVTEKAKDPSDLIRFLDSSKLEIADDGTVKGLEEEIAKLKETKSYLFDNGVVITGTGVNPSNTNSNKTDEQQLTEDYAEALKNGNMPMAIAIKNKLIGILNKKG